MTKWELDATQLGLKKSNLEQLLGGDARYNAQIARDLFAGGTSGNLGAVRDIVILNAAGGVVAYQAAKDPNLVGSELLTRFESAVQLVTSVLDSGEANSKLEQWVRASK
jgi:anthranilate phosphoribosyltransferase